MTRLLTTLMAVTVGVLGFGGTASAAPIVIDNFATALTPTAVVTSTGALVSSNPQSGAGILGSRVVSAQLTSGGGNASGQINTVTNNGIAATAGALDVGFVTYTYTFAALDLSTAMNLNMLIATDDGAGNVNAGLATLLINNGSGLTQVGATQQTNPLDINDNVNQNLVFGFGATPRNTVTQLQIRFDLRDGRDLSFGSSSRFFIDTPDDPGIPEPATVAICGIFGLAGLVGARRKLKAKKAAEATAAA